MKAWEKTAIGVAFTQSYGGPIHFRSQKRLTLPPEEKRVRIGNGPTRHFKP